MVPREGIISFLIYHAGGKIYSEFFGIQFSPAKFKDLKFKELRKKNLNILVQIAQFFINIFLTPIFTSDHYLPFCHKIQTFIANQLAYLRRDYALFMYLKR